MSTKLMQSDVSKTNLQYDDVVEGCRNIYLKKIKDYGTSWRILRPTSLTDQIFIKAQRIRTLEQTGVSRVGEGIHDEFRGIINYAIIALIQLEMGESGPVNLSEEKALELYNEKIGKVKKLMLDKNHDYGEAWRDMRISSFTDLILMKLLRVKQIEENDGKTLISEGVDSHYSDMINYSVFALIKLSEDEK
ncbi:MAG TPA: DUF1599 domain-containing protein [Chitinophagales bacterium]|nr:DUF1599 domain-containing protein [Chitinophagales bacterium]HMZ89598.1 DUF1599 domain-containing protein [Chitinophagales bacterium]HNJ89508.1 DUF1599 domain-containing protein [Chitinophagales bacterium]HNK98823.1 DUF1599 domain-containing protein [Chitinophagales bacterium]HNM09208.1 DUF1599 domain-containing protein [Chitinophagales bacterium]